MQKCVDWLQGVDNDKDRRTGCQHAQQVFLVWRSVSPTLQIKALTSVQGIKERWLTILTRFAESIILSRVHCSFPPFLVRVLDCKMKNGGDSYNSTLETNEQVHPI